MAALMALPRRIRSDTLGPVNTLIRTDEFSTWLTDLRDAKGKARIIARLESAALGNFGDCEPVGEGVSEMRIHTGPGYRVYYMRRGPAVYVLAVWRRQVLAEARYQTRHSDGTRPGGMSDEQS
jgi:putative addiction module killer protein